MNEDQVRRCYRCDIKDDDCPFYTPSTFGRVSPDPCIWYVVVQNDLYTLTHQTGEELTFGALEQIMLEGE